MKKIKTKKDWDFILGEESTFKESCTMMVYVDLNYVYSYDSVALWHIKLI